MKAENSTNLDARQAGISRTPFVSFKSDSSLFTCFTLHSDIALFTLETTTPLRLAMCPKSNSPNTYFYIHKHNKYYYTKNKR